MASNENKFIDRAPFILAAGKLSDNLGDSVANCLKQYSVDDASKALKYFANAKNAKPVYEPEPYKNKIQRGVYTEIRTILQPAVKTRYQTLINELKETSYESHWNKCIGKSRDPIPGLPKGLNPLEVTFGIKSNKDESVKELVNPPKGVYQVLTENQIAHEMYKKSHNDYNVGERICRNYLSPAFDSSKRFGERTKFDPRGIWVRCACTWHQNEPVVYTNKIQADFLNKTRNKLGECLRPNNIGEQLPKDFVYGKPAVRDLYGVEELLKDGDCPPCQFKRDLKCWLMSFNKMKQNLFKRFTLEFTPNDLAKSLLYYDGDQSGTLPLETFYKVCSCHRFTFDRANLEPLLRLLSIICEDKILYMKFLDIVDSKTPPLQLMKIQDVPERNQYYLSSSQAAVCDYLLINNASSPPAGIPSIRYDLSRPIVPHGGCRADLENLGDECSAAILLNPSVYCNYGLSFRDFFLPRKPDVLRSLFEKVGYEIDDASFEKLWTEGVDQDKTGSVCVDTFNNLVQKYNGEHKKLKIDEATC
ncbi:EF-hand domain-containing family member B [Tribolium castaneum]|uniref:EF-hand domain-containing family member B-like Protein n=1 Tax=Tribolium castaneum TaxID=7070 RepID=A0A139WGR8_TRICA|nr:PREDICTED: EF-hand domain-containing family member B [Tribolium castaneum]KYB27190.1 EF-hand domain-containing family member B-like Protein [Tribolium castaneum]|eukprot:XP_015836092.1 PREDICTED: EF-hand domain-containing family member B [Tribolium castaneum]